MRVLAFAYACEPEKGSEPGAGWTWVRMIGRSARTCVITRANNREAIERALPTLPERHSLEFVYVDLPDWARFWKRGQRGIRLYYLLWQVAALREARRRQRATPFDLVWHLTLANAWLGSSAALVGPAFVYGPVGGGVSMPWRLAPSLGARGAAYEVGRALARTAGRYVSPLSRVSWRRAEVVLAQNPETREWFPKRHRDKVMVVQNAVADAAVQSERNGAPPTALFAARLIPWKGGELALRALRLAPEWRLVVCGAGRDEKRLRALAEELDVSERVDFRGKLSQAELGREMSTASALLHPSLHDDSPLVVTEALAHGLPVVCLDRGGPPALAGDAALSASSDGKRDDIAPDLAAQLERVRTRSYQELALARAEELSFERRSETVAGLLEKVRA